jgi:hypothetical protein
MGDDVSTMTRKLGDGPKMNSKGKLHCFHCGAVDDWTYIIPELTGEQQGQLHKNLEAQDNGREAQEERHQLLNVALAQGGALSDNQTYLGRCSTMTAFKNDKYLIGEKKCKRGSRLTAMQVCRSDKSKGKLWETEGVVSPR